jgi:hypothetical protein
MDRPRKDFLSLLTRKVETRVRATGEPPGRINAWYGKFTQALLMAIPRLVDLEDPDVLADLPIRLARHLRGLGVVEAVVAVITSHLTEVLADPEVGEAFDRALEAEEMVPAAAPVVAPVPPPASAYSSSGPFPFPRKPVMFPTAARIRESSPPPNTTRLQREARAQGIDPAPFTDEELSYMLRYTPLEEITVHSLSTMTKPIFVYLMSFPPLSAARLQALKDEPANILRTNFSYTTITEDSSLPPLHLLWAAKVSLDANTPLVPTNNGALYSTVANSAARRVATNNPSEISTIYIRRTALPRIILYNDNDALSQALLNHPPLTVGRWLAVCDPTYQERVNFIQRHGGGAYPDAGSHVQLAAVEVDDRRPQSIGPYRPELDYSYVLDDLRSFALAEGLDPAGADATRLRQMLRRQQNAPTFYKGVDPRRCDPSETVYGDEYIQVPVEELYAYGARTDRAGKVRCYQRDELAQHFTSSRQFTDPLTQRAFAPEAVRRLELLAERDASAEGQGLTRSIRALREEQLDLDQQVLPLIERLRSASAEQQELLRQALKALLEVGMYMRKWIGPPAPYPLQAASTFQKVDAEVVQERVSTAIGLLRDILERLPAPIREAFWQLPLKRFVEGRYYSSTEATNGFTILQRLNIVAENRGTAACLRLSSNWFLFSALYWSTLLFREDWGIDPAAIEAVG